MSVQALFFDESLRVRGGLLERRFNLQAQGLDRIFHLLRRYVPYQDILVCAPVGFLEESPHARLDQRIWYVIVDLGLI